MQLYIQQRIFSWTDSYDVYDETGEARYEVKAEFFAFGHQIHVYDKRTGREVGSIHEKLFTFLPQFEIVIDGQVRGTIRKEFTFFHPKVTVDCNGWQVDGDWFAWDDQSLSGARQIVATVSKALWNWTDTYVIDVCDPRDALCALMLVLAIDAEKCSRND